jgi:hypothetical protein
MQVEEKARRTAAEEKGVTSTGSANRRSPTPSEMEGIELHNPCSSALPVAASNGVLHLVGQIGAPSASTQMQDVDEEMNDPPRSWTPDEDDEWGIGPSM